MTATGLTTGHLRVPRRRRINLDGGDFKGGDPALQVIGKSERPARRHAPQRPKPTPTANVILVSIRERMELLRPLATEYALLVEADRALERVSRKR